MTAPDRPLSDEELRDYDAAIGDAESGRVGLAPVLARRLMSKWRYLLVENDRLRTELKAKDEEIARLRSVLVAAADNLERKSYTCNIVAIVREASIGRFINSDGTECAALAKDGG